MRRYAQETSVSVEKSKAEIETRPRIAAAYQSGEVPPLLPGPRGVA